MESNTKDTEAENPDIWGNPEVTGQQTNENIINGDNVDDSVGESAEENMKENVNKIVEEKSMPQYYFTKGLEIFEEIGYNATKLELDKNII